MAQNDNHVYANTRLQSKDFARMFLMEGGRDRKRQSPFATLPDLGIALTPDEESDVRSYAARLGVDFERTAEEFAAQYQIIPKRSCGKMLGSLADRGLIPVNHLAIALKSWIHLEHWRVRNAVTAY